MSDRDPLLAAADRLAWQAANPSYGTPVHLSQQMAASSALLRDIAERHPLNPAVATYCYVHHPCPDRQAAERFAAVVLGEPQP